ncbi:MAG: hypothetical protein H6739_26965 [Alphaproteobacteria bacterium]|nr:hypothetical protein [Alphaproteobacteria bacterium]
MDRSLDSETLIPFLMRLLDDARGAGAVAAEVLRVDTQTTALSWKGDRRARPRRARALAITGAVYLDGGKAGWFKADTEDRSQLKRAVEDALRRARDARADDACAPADRYDINTRGLGIDDPRYETIDDTARLDVVRGNEAACTDVNGVDCVSVRYQDATVVRSFASSRGVQACSAETLYEVALEARDRTNGRTLVQSARARNFAHVGSLPYGVDLARRLADLRDEAAMPPGQPALVFETRVMATVLALLAPAFTSTRVRAGESFLADLKGRPIGHPRVHLIDDACMPGGVNTHAFDDRGVPSMPVPFIKEGHLGGLLYDPEEARRAGVRPTGHTLNGALAPSNLVLRAGNRSRTQMLGEVPLALCFDHLSGKVDIKTGRFDLSGPAFILERGQRQGVVPTVRLRGAITDLLAAVVEVASDQEREDAVDCATTLFKGFPVEVG